jgi:hypothetical protein
MLRRALISLTLLGLAAQARASDALTKPGRQYAVIDTPHIHALVPKHQIENCKAIVARCEVIYRRMAADAGYPEPTPLTLLLNDDSETHNGFSTVVPFAIIDIDMAPATQDSFIFEGGDYVERTFTHEVTHHLSNDRQFGFRKVLETIFGRILPMGDPLSLLTAYVSVPTHVTMPGFWQEGVAQWSETEYAPPGSPWGGRGRDSLTHMVWRLDAASGEGIPPPGAWRDLYQRWPFGSQHYVYGIAFTRYLGGAYGGQASIWQFIERLEHRWAFCFDGGPEPLVGKTNLELITEARTALEQEELAQLAVLRTQPVTLSKRLTPQDGVVAAPAWTSDGRLFAAYNDPFARPEFSMVDDQGRIKGTGWASWAMGEARSLPDGTLIYAETPVDDNPWRRSHVSVVTPGGVRHELPGRRMIQPDARVLATNLKKDFVEYQLVAIRMLPAARQQLVVTKARVVDETLAPDRFSDWTEFPSKDRPWSPTFRPGHEEISWVETDIDGSRLVLAPLADASQRTILATVHGRILHPAWTEDGAHIYLCADHTGVANAYRLDVDKPNTLIPVTNTIGGVLACVPRPGGGELAIIDHDRRGPYLARISDDPSTWPKQVPSIELAWPAPVGGGKHQYVRAEVPAEKQVPLVVSDASDASPAGQRFTLPDDPGTDVPLDVHGYHGLLEIRPLFWTPTTLAAPTGGYGVAGFAADKLFTHEIAASIGSGTVDGSAVGFASYLYGGWPIDLGAQTYRTQMAYDGIVFDVNGGRHNYAEVISSGEAVIGWQLLGFRRRWFAEFAPGVEDHRTIHRVDDQLAFFPVVGLPPFIGRERFTDVTVGYDDTTFFPTSFAPEDGNQLAATWRHSGYGGDKDGDRISARGVGIITVWPSQSHQLVLQGLLGWSRGQRYLQGEFAVGGLNGATLPRGYPDTVAVGNYFEGYSVAYRVPLWRPFYGFSTSPFGFRQLVLEGFFDAAKASVDEIGGIGQWYRSYGGQLNGQWEVIDALIAPGIGVAQQLDGKKNLSAYFMLDAGW